MNRLRRRLIASAAVLATLAVAHGQHEYPSNLMAAALANEFDAILTECPVPLNPVAHCYEAQDSLDHHKWRLENFVRSVRDVTWAVPWGRDGESIWRGFFLDNGDGYIVYLLPLDSFVTLVYVQELDD